MSDGKGFFDEVPGLGEPGTKGTVLRLNPQTRQRDVGRLEWGLLLHSTTDIASAIRPIFARAETVAENPYFAGAFAKRRAVVAANEYYIRGTTGALAGKWLGVSRADGQPMAWAGLWESCWRGHDDLVRSFCVVTVPANADVAPHQERMPLVLEKADLAVWFGEVRGDPAALLRPPPAGTLRLTPRKRPR